MGVISVKCRKCRHLLFIHPEVTLFNAHAISCSELSVKHISCSTVKEDNVWFLQDSMLPNWISDVVDKVMHWTILSQKNFRLLLRFILKWFYFFRLIGQKEKWIVQTAAVDWDLLISFLETNASVLLMYCLLFI